MLPLVRAGPFTALCLFGPPFTAGYTCDKQSLIGLRYPSAPFTGLPPPRLSLRWRIVKAVNALEPLMRLSAGMMLFLIPDVGDDPRRSPVPKLTTP
jgi:hypothetical protein